MGEQRLGKKWPRNGEQGKRYRDLEAVDRESSARKVKKTEEED